MHTGTGGAVRVDEVPHGSLHGLHLVVGIGAIIAFAIIPAVVNAVRWPTMSLQDKLAFNPLEPTLVGVENIAHWQWGCSAFS